MRNQDNAAQSAREFWETQYQRGPRPWTGRPNAILAQWTQARTPGQALDLGCGEGNSAIWLARHGWQVTGVDVSVTALARAAQHAERERVTQRMHFEPHDLGQSFPGGEFDLVYALYLQSPVAFPRDTVLQRAAEAVAPGGLLLVVDHASAAPWSWAAADTVFPPPEALLDALKVPTQQHWRTVFLGAPQRELVGPGGQKATVKDNVVLLERAAE